MKNNRRTVFIYLMILVTLLSCNILGTDAGSPVGDRGSGSPDNGTSDDDTKSFPFAPDPIRVYATLDTSLAVSAVMGTNSLPLKVEKGDGTTISFDLRRFYPLEMDAEEGMIFTSYDLMITMTPVASIEGLPFENPYLAAIHLGPDGLRSPQSARLSFEIPGEYDPAELIGFTAETTGEEFHLYPAVFESSESGTYVTFDIDHFSIYGVARATPGEIQTQRSHPPTDPLSQADQEYAFLFQYSEFLEGDPDLVPLNPAPDIALLLGDAFIQIFPLGDNTVFACSNIVKTTTDFLHWAAAVDYAAYLNNLPPYLDGAVVENRAKLLTQLEQCIPEECYLCTGNYSEAYKTKLMSMIAMIDLASRLSSWQNPDDYDGRNQLFWTLYNCLTEAHLPLPKFGGVGDVGDTSGVEPLCEP